ncbi:MAG: MFS transporter [Rhizobiaceae bacterium]|nr:MFS transporter [Rhizobiaceae bacterium]
MGQVGRVASTKQQSIAVATLTLSVLLASLGTSIVNIALPTLVEAFSAPFAHVQAVVVAYLGALTISVVIAGRLGDRFGLKIMLIVGLAIFASASLLCASSPSLWLLIAARALQGVGAAFLMTLAMALMRQTANEASVGRAMGLLGTVSALGTALGPALGGLLLPITGWRGIFWVQFPLAILALILTVTRLPREPRVEKARAVSLTSVLDRRLAPMLVTNILVAALIMSTLVVGPFYLGLGLGLDARHIGLVMAVGPVVSIVSGVPSGRLVDSLGSGRILFVGLVLMAVGALLLAILPNMIGVVGYLVAIIVLTPRYQLFQAANNTAALADAPKNQRGTVSGALNLSRNIGLIVGASGMAAVFAFGVGGDTFATATAHDIAVGLRVTFLLAAAMMIAALAIALIGGEARAR